MEREREREREVGVVGCVCSERSDRDERNGNRRGGEGVGRERELRIHRPRMKTIGVRNSAILEHAFSLSPQVCLSGSVCVWCASVWMCGRCVCGCVHVGDFARVSIHLCFLEVVRGKQKNPPKNVSTPASKVPVKKKDQGKPLG
jgi:hypothetical protein